MKERMKFGPKEKPQEDAIAVFERISKSSKQPVKIHPHEGYEESLEHRTRSAKRR